MGVGIRHRLDSCLPMAKSPESWAWAIFDYCKIQISHIWDQVGRLTLCD